MKTLEEAIRYYEEQAKKCNNRVNEIILGAERCKQDKEEYTQLADWLRELQERRGCRNSGGYHAVNGCRKKKSKYLSHANS